MRLRRPLRPEDQPARGMQRLLSPTLLHTHLCVCVKRNISLVRREGLQNKP
jgi:hypothetical protein